MDPPRLYWRDDCSRLDVGLGLDAPTSSASWTLRRLLDPVLSSRVFLLHRVYRTGLTDAMIKQRKPPYPQPLLELKLGSLFRQNLSQA